ncbi:MAG: O-antigen ligase family protein [Actinomycetota bacterium]
MSAPLLIVLAPVGAVVFILGLRAPLSVLLPAYAALVPFGSGIVVPVGLPPPFNTLTTVLGMAVTLATGVNLLTSRSRGVRLPPAVYVWMLFVGVASLTMGWSLKPSATLTGVLILVSLISLYAVTSLMPVSARDLFWLEHGIILGGLATGAYALYLVLGPGLTTTRIGLPRFATAGGVGSDVDPNITAAALLLPLAVAVGKAIQRSSMLERLGYGFSGAVIMAAITLTGSRGGMLATLIVLGVLIVNGRGRVAALSSGLLIVVIAVGTFSQAPEALKERIVSVDAQGSGRVSIWMVGLQSCSNYCWAGAGYGAFPEVYKRNLAEVLEASSRPGSYRAHNMWLGALIETGYLGVLLMTIALAFVVRDVLRMPREVRGPPLAGMAGVLASNMFLSNLGFKYFWLVITYATLAPLALGRPQVSVPLFPTLAVSEGAR